MGWGKGRGSEHRNRGDFNTQTGREGRNRNKKRGVGRNGKGRKEKKEIEGWEGK